MPVINFIYVDECAGFSRYSDIATDVFCSDELCTGTRDKCGYIYYNLIYSCDNPI